VPDDARLCKNAIIAWKIRTMSGLTHMGKVMTSTWTTPIVADSTDMDELDYVILSPDNIVHKFETEPQPFTKWLEGKKQQLAEKRREKPDLKIAA
jgi:hypothetical protein